MGDEHLKDIIGADSNLLAGHHIALGVCGSVACLEAPRLARSLMRHGAEVHAVLSSAAARLITPTAFHWATGNPVLDRLGGRVEHIELCGHNGLCSLLLIAPATASTVGKMAAAIDDTPVTTLAMTAIGARLPTLVAPGMHAPMYEHPGVKENLRRLAEMGIEVIPPVLAEHKAKMAPVETIQASVLRRLGPSDLTGHKVLLTGGPTREHLDPARCLTNPSSGRTAVEMTREALRRGARATLVYGPAATPPPPGARVIPVKTAGEMARAAEDELRRGGYSIFVAAAAVADFRPLELSADKLPTENGQQSLALVPTKKVINLVRELAPDITLVGFKAEAGPDSALLQAARDLLTSARADIVLANPVGRPECGFDSQTNRFWVVDAQQVTELPLQPKPQLARAVWDQIASRLKPRPPS